MNIQLILLEHQNQDDNIMKHMLVCDDKPAHSLVLSKYPLFSVVIWWWDGMCWYMMKCDDNIMVKWWHQHLTQPFLDDNIMNNQTCHQFYLHIINPLVHQWVNPWPRNSCISWIQWRFCCISCMLIQIIRLCGGIGGTFCCISCQQYCAWCEYLA